MQTAENWKEISEFYYIWKQSSQVAQGKRNCTPMQETRVQPLGWEDPLEKEMTIYSSILVWEILWTEEPGGLQFMGSQKSLTQLND